MSTGMGQNALWGLIIQSDFMTKMVMLTLFFMSIVCWAIALYKLILLKIKQEQCRKVLEQIKMCHTLNSALQVAQENRTTLPGMCLYRF